MSSEVEKLLLSRPGSEFGAVANYLKMPKDQLAEELKRVDLKKLAFTMSFYGEDDVDSITDAMSPEMKKSFKNAVMQIKKGTLRAHHDPNEFKKFVGMLAYHSWSFNYKAVFYSIILSLLLVYLTLGYIP